MQGKQPEMLAMVAVGAMGIVWNQATRWENIEAYLAEHYLHDICGSTGNRLRQNREIANVRTIPPTPGQTSRN